MRCIQIHRTTSTGNSKARTFVRAKNFFHGSGRNRTAVHISFPSESTRCSYSFGRGHLRESAIGITERTFSDLVCFGYGSKSPRRLSSRYNTNTDEREKRLCDGFTLPRAYARAVAKAKSAAPKYGEATFRALALSFLKILRDFESSRSRTRGKDLHVYAGHPLT